MSEVANFVAVLVLTVMVAILWWMSQMNIMVNVTIVHK